ncbi:MAG: class I tRNA ligase family protein, partial [Candidatus Gracilibacteria bacterium]|nr:class I tRNA ligase family protein [Candidatus Gracilibacteria bacterium]
PHCWRCDTPLIYRGINAWYVAVEKFRDKMVKNNEKITWVPENIKYGRFGNWLEGARDWNISRNRYWGSAIPVWQNEDKTEEVCIGSIEELYELNKDYGQIEKKDGKYYFTNKGKEVDIHKHFVDEILVKNPKTGNTLKRIPEVLDCWFESGAMPYAGKHYPFENKDNFKFPADFIAEGLDQTRGWFYTLLVLGTALFDNTPFLNVIVNGIVLAEDGKKMSKSLKNYPDPEIVMNTHGADAMRFYLMNSPVVKADDLRFSEAGVAEVVKKVILPFWNTYSFFTTYANIDNFEPDNTEIYFVRHGETDNNKFEIINGAEENQNLNEKGLQQAIETGKNLKKKKMDFDVIITSPLLRAKKTAEIIKEQIGSNAPIIEDKGFIEQYFGEYVGWTYKRLADELNATNSSERARIYRNNKTETLEAFGRRIEESFLTMKEKYKGKKVLIVGHKGTFRAMCKYLNNLTDEETYFEKSSNVDFGNASFVKLANYKKENNLDKWIIAELQELIKEVTTKLDNYDLQGASDPITTFLDKLTNWYIRRSRRRFWKSENDGDKMEAYNTLYEVLVELSKIIAPFMPFVSEEIFKGLTAKKSVHLEYWSEYNEALIIEDLTYQMDKTQKIVNLGLALRADKKIRVRQPLNSINITEKLEDYYLEIIKEELNVKEVIYLADSSAIARKVCRPNAKLIGPKFGKDVQTVIVAAKAGDFEEIGEGKIKVGDFILEANEYEIAFEPTNLELDIEANFGMVIAMDTQVTESLRNEGYARDLVRVIQDARKEAGYNVSDRINISINGSNLNFIEDFKDYIESETLSKIGKFENGDIKKELELEDDWKVEVVLKK